jgi:hypothetical protein
MSHSTSPGRQRVPSARRGDFSWVSGRFRLRCGAIQLACGCPEPVAIRCATDNRTRRGMQPGIAGQSPQVRGASSASVPSDVPGPVASTSTLAKK